MPHEQPAPLKACQCVLHNEFHPERPTIVLTHGWRYRTHPAEQHKPTAQLLDLGERILRRFASNASVTGVVPNIVHAVWPGASEYLRRGVLSTPLDLVRGTRDAFERTRQEGIALGEELLHLLGADVPRGIHWIGHSFGALVNAHSYALIARSGLRCQTQWTCLDLALQWTAGGQIALRRLLLPAGFAPISRADAYFGLPFCSLGTALRSARAMGWTNHRVARTHCGVIDFYAASVLTPRSRAGFNRSIIVEPASDARSRSDAQAQARPSNAESSCLSAGLRPQVLDRLIQ